MNDKPREVSARSQRPCRPSRECKSKSVGQAGNGEPNMREAAEKHGQILMVDKLPWKQYRGSLEGNRIGSKETGCSHPGDKCQEPEIGL